MKRFPALGVGFLIRSVPLVAAVAVVLVLPAPALATFPGANGKIAYNTTEVSLCGWQIHTINPDGTGDVALTSGIGAFDLGPAWSPDGQKIAFWRSPCNGGTQPAGLYVMNADGTGQTKIADCCAEPAWSPDGTKIVSSSYGAIWVVNADGTGLTLITGGAARDEEPAWSPGGGKIAFQRTQPDPDPEQSRCVPDIWLMNPDGTVQTDFTNLSPCPPGDFPFGAYEPSWSPGATKIAYGGQNYGGYFDIFWSALGQSGRQQVTGGDIGTDRFPAWSPDGQKIAAWWSGTAPGEAGIRVMNPDGTDVTTIAHIPNAESLDWQPIQRPHTAPVGASPMRVSLVPAFKPCETADSNATHGAPLSFPSCSNPTPTSSTVTTGSNALGFARLVVCWVGGSTPICNDPQGGGFSKPDVRILGSIRDVKCAASVPAGCSPGADYNPNSAPGPYTTPGNGADTGGSPPCFPSATSPSDCLAGADMTWVAELPGATTGATGTQFEGKGVRITDSDNDPAKSASGTVADLGFPIPLDCLPNPSAKQGSTCGVSSTANALVPGVVKQGKAAVWQVGQIELRDSGPDGVRGNGDDERFATQGVFLP